MGLDMDPTLWFKPRNRATPVEVGAIFEHRLPNLGVVETAKVLDISRDSMGVPHVTYDLTVERQKIAEIHDRRTLGLASFNQRFMVAV